MRNDWIASKRYPYLAQAILQKLMSPCDKTRCQAMLVALQKNACRAAVRAKTPDSQRTGTATVTNGRMRERSSRIPAPIGCREYSSQHKRPSWAPCFFLWMACTTSCCKCLLLEPGHHEGSTPEHLKPHEPAKKAVRVASLALYLDVIYKHMLIDSFSHGRHNLVIFDWQRFDPIELLQEISKKGRPSKIIYCKCSP